MTLGNGAGVTFTFDDASQTTGIHHHTSGGGLIASYGYAYNDAGVRTSVVEGSGDRVTWSYDATWRLTREQRSGTNAYDTTYSYDPVGSRATRLAGGATTTYSYNAGAALTLENAAGALTTYSWDNAGNNTGVNAAGTLTTMTWDAENRLATLVGAGGTATLTYDATGLRRKRQDGAGTTDFLWDGQRLLAELSGGSTVAQYTSGPAAYGPMLSQRRGATSRFYHPSVLGTIETLTDASAAVTDSYVLTAFGVQVASSGSTVNPHRYIGALGYYADPTTGLDYVRARWLRPSTGSWLSVDPVEGEPRYLYAGGRASWANDPGGLQYGRDFPGLPPWARARHPVEVLDRIVPPFPPPPQTSVDVVYPGRNPVEGTLAAIAAAVTQVARPLDDIDFHLWLPPEPRPQVTELVLIGHGGSGPQVGPRIGGPDIEPGPTAMAYPGLHIAKIWACHQGTDSGDPLVVGTLDQWCEALHCTVIAPDGLCFGPIGPYVIRPVP